MRAIAGIQVASFAFCASCLVSVALAQTTPQPQDIPPREEPRQLLSAEQLDALVAPIALYPDPLLSQVLAASTYPLELVEVQQWLPQHSDLRGSQLVDAAKQMNWDPSVQAMVAFPDVLRVLTQNVRWTTDLGNAFLAQQSGVMDAIQHMRANARQNGRLARTPQQVVTTQTGPGQSAIAIQPADPRVIYVPVYNPYYVWGPAPVGDYPPLWYPPLSSGYGFGVAISIGAFFAGLLNWSGWGWGLSWLTHGLFLNGLFFSHFGFGGGGFGGGYGGRSGGGVTAWAHNPAHRLGVPYPNGALASRFAGVNPGGHAAYGGNRVPATPYRGGWQGFDGRPRTASAGSTAARSLTPSDGWRSFGSRGSSEATYRGQYRGSPGNGGYSSSNTRASGSIPASGYREAAPGPTGFRGETRAYQGPAASSRAFSSPSHPSGEPRSYASAAPTRRFSRGAFSEPRGSGGGHFSAPKSSGHFKAPKVSSHSSGHSSGGHSGGHSKGGHHR